MNAEACLLLASPQEVLQLGGVELLLSQCQLDEDSPLTREWALFAIRNLSIGNTDVQERIRVSGTAGLQGCCCCCLSVMIGCLDVELHWLVQNDRLKALPVLPSMMQMLCPAPCCDHVYRKRTGTWCVMHASRVDAWCITHPVYHQCLMPLAMLLYV
jgi:hypothetical protein